MCVRPATAPAAATISAAALSAKDERTLVPLHQSSAVALGLSFEEQAEGAVFALGADMRDFELFGEESPACLAVARFVPKSEWATIEQADQIIYTELFVSDNSAEPLRALASQTGRLRVYDAKRDLLYTETYTDGVVNSYSYTTDDVLEIWVITRFIELA